MNRGTGLTRTGRLSPMSAKRRAGFVEAGIWPVSTLRTPTSERPARTASRSASTGPTRTVRNLVLTRDRRCCVRCGTPISPAMWWSLQHRRARQGLGLADSNGTANLIILCGSATSQGCHAAAEARSEAERLAGYWVRQITNGATTDPATIPVLHAVHGWVLLDNDGGWSTT